MKRLRLDKEQLFRIIETIELEEEENIEEITGAASSGAFVGPLNSEPIHRTNVGDELEECDNIKIAEAEYGKDIITQHTTKTPKKTKKGTIKKVKKSTYNFKSGTKDKNCTLCRYYIKDTNRCELVYGNVDKNGICDNYKHKSTNEMSSGAYDVPFGGPSKDGNKGKKEPMIKGGTVLTKESLVKKLTKRKIKLTEHQLNHIKETFKKILGEKNGLAYSGGGFVKIDDCTKLNNNKEAQNGGCSQGAVDGVVTLTKTADEDYAHDLDKKSK